MAMSKHFDIFRSDGQILTKVMRIRFSSEYVLLSGLLPPALCHDIETEVES